jgi:S1-C subfamily serine protease
VQANQAGEKIAATVEAIAPGIDLAVLKLEDESFFESRPPLTWASALPEIKDPVMAYGYPQGGTTLSITKGIISRIEFERYQFPVAGLRIQIDAAINPGNSGGPVLVGDRMIGLAFSHLGGAENIGYIIPCEEIELFLKDVEDGRYDGKPAMYDGLQTLENATLRPFLKLEKLVQGIIVNKPFSEEANYPLKQWDVITRIGDTPIDSEGMVKMGSNSRIRFNYLVQRLAKNGKLDLTIVRHGKEMKIQMPVQTDRPAVVPSLNGAYPSYFIYGPLAFSSATRELLGGSSDGMMMEWTQFLAANGNPLLGRIYDKPAFEGEGIVLIASPLFPHRLSKGYSNPIMQVVKSINGQKVRNLGHLVEIIRDSRDEFLTIEFDSRFGGETIVLPRTEALKATEEILTDNGIRSQGSSDTMAVWNAKPAK